MSDCWNCDTRGVPSSRTRFSATTREMLFGNGDAQRLNSSIDTWFGPVLTTICGRSTIAGIDTGPTTTDSFDVAVPADAVGLNV